MKPQPPLIAERPAAQHCPELLRAAPGTAELLPLFERAAERFARALAPALAPLMGGKAPLIKPGKAKRGDLAELTMFSPDLAANSLLGLGGEDWPLLVTLDAGAVLRIVDRTFGGRGEAPSPLPDVFPVSAELMIVRLEGIVIESLGAALTTCNFSELRPLRRNASLAELEPFPPSEPLAALDLEVIEPGGDSWLVTLALPLPTLGAVFGDAPRLAPGPARDAADPATEPFAGVPLELIAVLVEMQLPLTVVAALEPGMVLPVAVARQVPLRTSGLAVATGTVGAAEDRVALQITNAF